MRNFVLRRLAFSLLLHTVLLAVTYVGLLTAPVLHGTVAAGGLP